MQLLKDRKPGYLNCPTLIEIQMLHLVDDRQVICLDFISTEPKPILDREILTIDVGRPEEKHCTESAGT